MDPSASSDRQTYRVLICSCACCSHALMSPSFKPLDVTRSHRCNALGPQRIVIRSMQAAPSFVHAAAQWLCKTPVHVSQARPPQTPSSAFEPAPNASILLGH